jgi:hypothetical protein
MRHRWSVLSSFLLLPLCASAGSVKSMSGERDIQGPDGAIYVMSEVNCSGRKEDRVIWRAVEGGDWCAKAIEGYCSRRKISAAKLVCDRGFERELEKLEAGAGSLSDRQSAVVQAVEKTLKPASESSAPAATTPPAVGKNNSSLAEQKEQLAIERERLKLEQDRLELRRQQVELQKQELEIKRQLDAQQRAEQARQAEATLSGKPEKLPVASGATVESEALQPASSGVNKNVLGM